MSPHTLSVPQSQAAAPSPSEDLCSTGASGQQVGVAAHSGSPGLASITMPCMNPGKSIPGPDEWRALERRASSFRA